MQTNSKTIEAIDIKGKKTKLAIDEINQIINDNIDGLKRYEKLTDIANLQKGCRIKYIQLGMTTNTKMAHGGVVGEIIKKGGNDYLIKLDGIGHHNWNILYSRVIIFYQIKTAEQERQEQREQWKKTHPDYISSKSDSLPAK